MTLRSLRTIALFVCFAVPFLVSAAFNVPPRPTTLVNDYANLLTKEQVTSLESKLEAYEKQSSNEIAIVTVPTIGDDTIENAAQNIFTAWGIGKKDKNNGVLVLVAAADHQMRIQTGYGVEGQVTDIAASYIQQDIMTPAFRNNDYYGGLNGAADKLIAALGGADVTAGASLAERLSSGQFPWQVAVFLVLFVLQFFAAILGRSKSWWGGGVVGGVIGLVLWIFHIITVSFIISGIIFFVLVGLGLLFDFIVSRAYERARGSGGNFPWWIGGGRGPGGFGGFGGGGGGGFGGFGGGSSGGGGASGSW